MIFKHIIKRMQTEIIAADNLREESQSTQYIFDWSSPLQLSHNDLKRSQVDAQKGPITQKKASQSRLFILKKVNSNDSISKPQDKKSSKKQDILSRFEFPILQEGPLNTLEGKKAMHGKMKMSLAELKREMEQRGSFNRVIDRIVDQQFKRMNQQIYRSINSQRSDRLISQFQTHQTLFKSQINSLPLISRKKQTRVSEKWLSSHNPAILINNCEPPARMDRQASLPTCRVLKGTLLE